MPLMFVAVLSVLVGCAVYLGRSGPAVAVGDRVRRAGAGRRPSRRSSRAHRLPGTPTSRSRRRVRGSATGCRGLVGVIMLLGVGAAALAFALYELGHPINRTIEAFLD